MTTGMKFGMKEKSTLRSSAWIILALLFLAALCADFGLLGSDFAEFNTSIPNQPPSHLAWLGTDGFGRNVLSRLFHGLSISLKLGIISSVLAVSIGSILGILSATTNSLFDRGLRLVAISIDAIPYILLASVLAFLLGQGLTPLIFALASTGWTSTYRIVRAESFKLKGTPFARSAIALGQNRMSFYGQTLFPSLKSTIFTQLGLFAVFAIKFEVALSFLGIGMAPGTPSLGSLISDARLEFTQGIWWTLIPAGLLLFILALALNILTSDSQDTSLA